MDGLGMPRKGLILTEGVILAILGTLSLVWPVLSTFGLEILLGWLLLIGGAVQGYRAFQSKGESGFWGTFFLSILFLLFGILWLVYPVAGVISLGLFLLFFFLLEGISQIVLAFELRHFSGWGWLLTNGFLSLIMAGIIWSGWPVSAFWVPGLLFGINLIFSGATLFFFGLKLPCHRCH